uniref:Copine C-terminal domain-containing protein n=1 Tax=Falco tinnunculus TaxID=100819 RepID=A0A8C4U8U5_FALTI
MSIIIVGVDKADFKAVEFLDGDNGVLKSLTGKPVAQDSLCPVCAFQTVKKLLSQMVLAEVPKQLVSYCKWQGWPPVKWSEIMMK